MTVRAEGKNVTLTIKLIAAKGGDTTTLGPKARQT